MPIRILGLDPGLRHTGWGVVTSEGNRLSYVAHGVVSSDTRGTLGSRLKQLHEGLQKVIQDFKPDEAAVEETFVNRNPTSTLKLGMARGVVLLAPGLEDLPIGEYSPNRVKKTVVGAGHADKNQVTLMVARLLPESRGATEDAADALAVAICHAHHRQTHNLWGVA